jgi:transposase
VSSSSPLADAIGYMLRHWSGLVLFLDDGRLEIDTNVVERGMKGVAVARNYVPPRIMRTSPRRYTRKPRRTAAERAAPGCRYRA